jgi:hypothetical protein
MLRLALVSTLLLGGSLLNEGGGEGGPLPDAPDEPDPDGSGSNVVFEGEDPSPPDLTLQWIVVGLSTVIVLAPVRSRRRSKRAAL